jgi:hypothetical protein
MLIEVLKIDESVEDERVLMEELGIDESIKDEWIIKR